MDNKQQAGKALLIIILLLFIALAFLIFIALKVYLPTTIYKTDTIYLYHNYNSSIRANITSDPYMVIIGTLNLKGPGINDSIPIYRSSSGVACPSESTTGLPCPLPNEIILFNELKPLSLYNLSFTGSASPICIKGNICPFVNLNTSALPDYIVALRYSKEIETGPNASTINISVSLEN
ncbi:hypothetical protein Mia14_0056 [Candidatus Mancarchaeum acidiphilum]|uniref:Uncharacterized protein n=1 Tax=Candidatus Mancarchaeum acidiphilum TaxID=1920749 RepID=A0A218NLR2_9ARCH|nr:hypothetical protein [Candidatus Mancarchaeum acidiphilum]ASI13399.1 hypothetical protein Mia14_0056 [Candidatus Mancarchaeum acidiphilum]